MHAPAIYYRHYYLVLDAAFDGAAFRDPEEAEAHLNECYLGAGGRFVLDERDFPRLFQTPNLKSFAEDVARHLERGRLVLVLAGLWDASAVQLQIELGSYQIHQITILPIVP